MVVPPMRMMKGVWRKVSKRQRNKRREGWKRLKLKTRKQEGKKRLKALSVSELFFFSHFFS